MVSGIQQVKGARPRAQGSDIEEARHRESVILILNEAKHHTLVPILNQDASISLNAHCFSADFMSSWSFIPSFFDDHCLFHLLFSRVSLFLEKVHFVTKWAYSVF